LTPPSISLVEKIKIFFVSGRIHDHGLLALWKSNMDALPVGKTTSGCWKNSGSMLMSWNHKSPTEIWPQLDSANLCTNMKTREAITKFGFTALPPSTLQPCSSTVRFPSVWSRKGCSPQYKVWDWWWWCHAVRTWLHK
jgi:hypothetical protein